MLTLEKARANRTPIEWDDYTPPVPAQGIGVQEFETTTSPSYASTSTGSRSSSPGR